MAKLWSFVGLVGVVLAVAILAQTGAGQGLMRDVGLSKTPSAYTQLSFARPQSLPGTVTTPRATVRVPFEIRNTSAAQRTYQWSVTLRRGQRTDHLTSGGTRVPAGAAVTVAPSVTVACVSGRIRVEVGLASPRESIDFYATCVAPSGSGGGTS
jgi:hypothetical protein